MKLTVVWGKKAREDYNKRKEIADKFGISPQWDVNNRSLTSPCDIPDSDIPLLKEYEYKGDIKIYWTKD